MILNQFFSGLNNLVDESLLNNESATVFTNIDNISGSIVSLKTDKRNGSTTNNKGTIYFNRLGGQMDADGNNWWQSERDNMKDLSLTPVQYGPHFIVTEPSSRVRYQSMRDARNTERNLGILQPSAPSVSVASVASYVFPTAAQINVEPVYYISRRGKGTSVVSTTYNQTTLNVRMVLYSLPDEDNNNIQYAIATRDITLQVGKASGQTSFGPTDDNDSAGVNSVLSAQPAQAGFARASSSVTNLYRIGFNLSIDESFEGHDIRLFVRADSTNTDGNHYELPLQRQVEGNAGGAESNMGITSTYTVNSTWIKANGTAFTGLNVPQGTIGQCKLTYKVTHGYDAEIGSDPIESIPNANPTERTDQITVGINSTVLVSDIQLPEDDHVNLIYLYRLCESTDVNNPSGNTRFIRIATFRKVGSDWVLNGTLTSVLSNGRISYTDGLVEVSNRNLISPTDNNPPVFSGVNPSFIGSAYDTFFALVDDKLYYSKRGQPDYWPAENFLQFNDKLTGFLPASQGILVFTKNTTSLVTGTTPTTFGVLSVANGQGCVDHKLCRYIREIPTWVSLDGVCQYRGGRVSVISRSYIEKETFRVFNNPNAVKHSAVHDEVYYIVASDNSTNGDYKFIGVDFRRDVSFTEYNSVDNTTGRIQFIGSYHDDTLYSHTLLPTVTVPVRDKPDFTFQGDNYRQIQYTSPLISFGLYSHLKNFKDISFRYSGKLHVDIVLHRFSNTVGMATKTIPVPLNENKLNYTKTMPLADKEAYAIQFKVQGLKVGAHYDKQVLHEIHFNTEFPADPTIDNSVASPR